MALFPPKNPAPAPAPIPMPAAARPTTLSAEDIARARNIGSQIRGRFAQTLVGQDNLRESLITTLVAGGHILIESVPGLAKPLPRRPWPLRCPARSNVCNALPI